MLLKFSLPNEDVVEVEVVRLLNAGYAGRNQDHVRAHIAELALLGIPAPRTTPTLYPVSPYLAQQTSTVHVQHARTSGEAEWAIVIPDDGGVLLTLACDHTDRALEVHGIAWSKNAAPDVLASSAWRLAEIETHLDALRLAAWVTHQHGEQEIQSATLANLLPPSYWIELLRRRDLLTPGTVLLSGTVTMHPGIDQFASAWRLELVDPVLKRGIGLAYDVVPMPAAID